MKAFCIRSRRQAMIDLVREGQARVLTSIKELDGNHGFTLEYVTEITEIGDIAKLYHEELGRKAFVGSFCVKTEVLPFKGSDDSPEELVEQLTIKLKATITRALAYANAYHIAGLDAAIVEFEKSLALALKSFF
jgi:hypothetical protein